MDIQSQKSLKQQTNNNKNRGRKHLGSLGYCEKTMSMNYRIEEGKEIQVKGAKNTSRET